MSQLQASEANQILNGPQDLEDREGPSDINLFGYGQKSFFSKFFRKPLLVSNEISEARDVYNFERNFLAWLNISLALALSGAAIMANLRFIDRSDSPHDLANAIRSSGSSSAFDQVEQLNLFLKRSPDGPGSVSYPLGILFYALSFLAILVSFYSYIATINAYCNKKLNVASSYVTTTLICIIAMVILGTNIFVLWQLY